MGKPYMCEICSASFSDFSSLNRHSRIHSGDKPYKCAVCSALFTRADNLKAHSIIHNEELDIQFIDGKGLLRENS